MSAFPIGIALPPSINILGAYFPDWMFCIAGAIGLTMLVHHALLPMRMARPAGRVAWMLVYPALGILFALSGWLIFFQN